MVYSGSDAKLVKPIFKNHIGMAYKSTTNSNIIRLLCEGVGVLGIFTPAQYIKKHCVGKNSENSQ